MYPTPERPEYGIFVKSQNDSLEKAGAAVEVFVLHGRGVGKYLGGVRGLRKRLRKGDFDVVHAHYGLTGAVAVAAGAHRVAPLAISFCGDDINASAYLGFFPRMLSYAARQMGLRAAFKADLLIVKSRALYEKLPAELAGRTEIVPNGVDPDLFFPLDRDDARRRLGFAPDARIVLFAAHPANPVKNFALARDAVGKVPGAPTLVPVYGKSQQELNVYYNAADVLLITSLQEGSINTLKEALAANLPVVSVDVGDSRERLAGVSPGGVYGYSPDEIAVAIGGVLDRPRRSNGREKIASITVREIAVRLTALFDSLPARRDKIG